MYGPVLMGSPAAFARVLVTGLLFAAGGCAFWKPAPTPILPPEGLYQIGETELGNRPHDEARQNFRKIGERHPNSAYAARARFPGGAARQGLELVLKDYPRTFVIPETLFLLAEVNFYEGKVTEGNELFRRLSAEYGYTEWGGRANARLRAQR